MEFHLDDLAVSPTENRQPWEDRRQYYAETIQGNVKASIVFRWYDDKPRGYVMDHHGGRVNERHGTMSAKQREQARMLGIALEEQVRKALLLAGWRVIGSTRLAIDVWQYYGSQIHEMKQQLNQLARHVWHGSYPWQENAKVGPLEEVLFDGFFLAHRWYPLGDDLEVALDPVEKLLRVRRQQKRGTQEEQQREAGGKCPLMWIWHTFGDACFLFVQRDRSTND